MPNNSFLPDYYERDFEYDALEYQEGASHSANLKLYRDWRTLWAQRLFHEACEDYNWREPKETGIHVSDYPYHPGFAEAFAERVGGIHEDGSRLALADVEYSLEDWYGGGLEQPDCDYLADILEDTLNGAKLPQNVERALKWLTAKKSELPIWPPKYTEPDVHGKKHRVYVSSNKVIMIEDSLVGEDLIVKNKSGLQTKQVSTDPFLKLLPSHFPFSLLQQLLLSLKLIEAGDKSTTIDQPGVWRAVIFALRKHRCIRNNSEATSKAFMVAFSAKVSPRYLQGKQGFSSLRNDEQRNMFRETEDKLSTLIVRDTN